MATSHGFCSLFNAEGVRSYFGSCRWADREWCRKCRPGGGGEADGERLAGRFVDIWKSFKSARLNVWGARGVDSVGRDDDMTFGVRGLPEHGC